MRPSTLDERRRFYAREFDLRKVRSWFAGRRLPQLCAVDAGSETGIIVDEKLKGEVLYFPFSELRKKLSKYAPEDVYYDRNVYDDPKRVLRTLRFGAWREQELVFDIDADNIPCTHPKTQDACPRCIAKALSSAKRIKVTLGKEYRDVRIVYSGRGFHVHVLDDEAWRLSVAQREPLSCHAWPCRYADASRRRSRASCATPDAPSCRSTTSSWPFSWRAWSVVR